MGFRFRDEEADLTERQPSNIVQITASQSSVVDADGKVQHDHQLYALCGDGSIWAYHFVPTYGPYWRRLPPLDDGRREGRRDGFGRKDGRFDRAGRLIEPE